MSAQNLTRSCRSTKTISAPWLFTPATFTAGESLGMTMTARTPNFLPAKATAWA